MLKSNQLELRHFRYFMAVAQELNFRKAAEVLFISQPGLSRQIKQMEEILGVALFVRDTRKVVLTTAGSYLVSELRFIFNRLEGVERQLTQIASGNLGEVRIGFLGSAMQNVIPKLLVGLQKKFPKVKTSLEEFSNKAQLRALLDDRLDLGFVRLERVPEGMEMKTVFTDDFSLVVPENFRIKSTNFKGMYQFKEEDFILFSKDYSPYYYETVMSICKDAQFTPKVSHKSVHAQSIFKLVENNMGIAIVPSSFKEGFKLKVHFISLRALPQRAILSAVWKKDNRSPVLAHCLGLLFGKELKKS